MTPSPAEIDAAALRMRAAAGQASFAPITGTERTQAARVLCEIAERLSAPGGSYG